MADRHGVEQFVTADINQPASVAKLKSWNPDLIISTNFSHYIGRTVRERVAQDIHRNDREHGSARKHSEDKNGGGRHPTRVFVIFADIAVEQAVLEPTTFHLRFVTFSI